VNKNHEDECNPMCIFYQVCNLVWTEAVSNIFDENGFLWFSPNLFLRVTERVNNSCRDSS